MTKYIVEIPDKDIPDNGNTAGDNGRALFLTVRRDFPTATVKLGAPEPKPDKGDPDTSWAPYPPREHRFDCLFNSDPLDSLRDQVLKCLLTGYFQKVRVTHGPPTDNVSLKSLHIRITPLENGLIYSLQEIYRYMLEEFSRENIMLVGISSDGRMVR